MSACPPQDMLERLLSESLSEDERDTVEEHLDGCAACQDRLEQMTAGVGARWRTVAAEPAPCEPSVVFPDHLAGSALAALDTFDPDRAEPLPAVRPPDVDTAPNTGSDGGAAPSVPGYQILSELGRGGMGVVYLARQKSLNRMVALKMILSGAHAGVAERARFRAEAEAVARLQHPNIVQIYEVGEHDGLPFLCLEYVPGGSLARYLAGTPQPARSTAAFVETLARAVHAAHERGIVHRDLKPANVLLVPNPKSETRNSKQIRITQHPSSKPPDRQVSDLEASGLGIVSDFGFRISDFVPKITDFGLAKRLDSDTLGAPSTIAGTPSYMAPEQVVVEGRSHGPAMDVYALGAILYEMLTGRPPFRAETPYETLMQVVHQDPVSPRQFQPRLPRDLDTICLKCLAKDPARRYATALDLADDLSRCQAGQPILARPAGMTERAVKWARRRPAIAGLLALVALVTLVGLALVLWQWDRAERRAEDARVKEQQERQLRREVERLSAGTLIDQAQALCEQGEIGRGLLTYVRGLELAQHVEDADLERIARVGLATWPRQLIREPARFSHHSWAIAAALSPDGRTVVTAGWLDKVAQRWQADSGAPIGAPLRHAYPVSAVAISPDGKFLLTGASTEDGGKGEARLWEAATGKLLGSPLAHDAGVISVAFNPRDGRTFLTVTQRQAQLWDTATRRPVGPPLQHGATILTALFSPDGKRVLTAGAVPDRDKPNGMRGEAMLWDAATGQRQGGPLTHGGPIQAAAFSPDGKRIVTGGWDNTARLWEAATGKPGPVLKHRGLVAAVAFSGDGETVATGGMVLTLDAERQVPTEGGGEARLWDARTGKPLGDPLPHPRTVGAVALSPDGRILLTGCKDGKARFFRVASGEPIGPDRVQEGVVNSVAFGRDGKTALTTCAQGGEGYSAAHLWDLPPEPEPRHDIPYPGAPIAIGQLAFSPNDQGKVLLTGAEDQTARLWDLATGKTLGAPLTMTGAVTAVAFSPDGKRLLTAGWTGGLYAWDRATGRLLYHSPHAGQVVAVAFRPDGRTFVTVTATDVRRVQVWNAATGKPDGPSVTLKALVLGLNVLPDGKVVVVQDDGGQIGLWDVEGRRFLRTWPHPRPGFGWLTAALSPDGHVLVTGGDTAYAQLWDVTSGRAKGPPLPHQAKHFAFSPDGRTVATCGRFGRQVRLWDVATGRALGVPLWQRDAIASVAFRPDGRALVVGGHALCVWPTPEPLPGGVEAIRRRMEGLTGLELDADGAIRELDPDALRQRRSG